jgi:hypothetical protein
MTKLHASFSSPQDTPPLPLHPHPHGYNYYTAALVIKKRVSGEGLGPTCSARWREREEEGERVRARARVCVCCAVSTVWCCGRARGHACEAPNNSSPHPQRVHHRAPTPGPDPAASRQLLRLCSHAPQQAYLTPHSSSRHRESFVLLTSFFPPPPDLLSLSLSLSLLDSEVGESSS